MNIFYCDHAATTPCLPEVWALMEKYATQDYGNPNSFHRLGLNARRAMDQARERIAALLGGSEQEILFTSGGSESINLALRGAARANPHLGRGIVTSGIEHEATRRACEALNAQGYKTTVLAPDAYGQLTPEQVADAVQDDTAIVSILHANNEIGTIQPLAEIVSAVRRKKSNVIIHADAVQSVGHIPINVEELGVDLLSFTAHKFYGPKGVGGLYVRKGTQMEAEIVGGNQECGLRGGTESVPLIVGMAAALQAAILEMKSERAYWRPFRDQVESTIRKLVPGCRSNGHPSERLDHLLSMSFLGVEEKTWCCLSTITASVHQPDRHAIFLAARLPTFYRRWVFPAPRNRGSLRLTFGHGCRHMDADWLAHQVAAAVSELRSVYPVSPRVGAGNQFSGCLTHFQGGGRCVMDRLEFEFDAMLMYGWVADADLMVRRVNTSLKDWLVEFQPHIYRAIESEEGLYIADFFAGILILPNDVSHEILSRLEMVKTLVLRPSIPQDVPYSQAGVEVKYDFREIKNHGGMSSLVFGIRAVDVGGFPMRSSDIQDRVDLITVCHTQKNDAGTWCVRGFQGQLQNAWLRVQKIVREGTKSGAVALMGRNLSHNIGSHALFWLEQDIDSKIDKSTSRFYRYLRERMELIAGFATSMSLSPRTLSFEELIEGFTNNTVLTTRLCKSERVTRIKVKTRVGDRKRKMAIPGGNVGTQAFYSILENIIRDNAKYGPHEGEMAVRIHLDEMTGSFADEFWKVTIIDDDAETTPKTVEPIQAGLRDLIIANENGYLKEGFWGVKERFIAAALLRGMRVEDIVDELKVEVEEIKVEESTGAGQFSYWNLNRTKDGEPPILSVTTEGTSLAWEFYVLKAREVLVAGTGIELAPELQDEVNIQSMEWLKITFTALRPCVTGLSYLFPKRRKTWNGSTRTRQIFPSAPSSGAVSAETPSPAHLNLPASAKQH